MHLYNKCFGYGDWHHWLALTMIIERFPYAQNILELDVNNKRISVYNVIGYYAFHLSTWPPVIIFYPNLSHNT